jgi:hypothetical protein
VLVISTLLSLAVWMAPTSSSQKPVVDMPIVADAYNPPSTLDDLVARSDAVIIARIKRAIDRSSGQQARTDYEIVLSETVKGHVELTSTAVVCRGIGTIDQPHRTVRVFQPNFPAFQPGAEYLLFLRWDDAKKCFFSEFGPTGSALVDRVSGVKPFVSHPAIGALKGLQGAELVRALKAAKGAR